MWNTIEKRYEIAKHFHKFGMLLTRIYGNEEYENSYKDPHETWTFLEQTEDFLLTRNWDEATGIGIQLGHNGFRAIDIDNVMCSTKYRYFIPRDYEYIARRELLYNCLSILGLPSNYEWVVESPHGYHIIIKTDEVNNMHDSVAYLPNSHFEQKTAEQISFSRMELLWRSHLVLPPSTLKDKYTIYRFYNCVMPQKAPQRVEIGTIDNLLNYYCGTRGFANKLDTGYDDFYFNGAHFFMAEIKKRASRGSVEDMYCNSRAQLFAFDGLDSNLSWLKACSTAESFNKLGLIAFAVRNAPDDAKKYFEASNSIYSSYNLACLIALNKIKGDVNDMMKCLSSNSIEKQHKDELRVIFYHKHRRKPNNLFFSISTSALKDDTKFLDLCIDSPRLIELSWIQTDSNLNVIWNQSTVFKYNGYVTPLRVTQAGGPSHDFVKNFGTGEVYYPLLEFAKALSDASNVICYDAQFCTSILHNYIKDLDFTCYDNEYPVSKDGLYKEIICLKKTTEPLIREIYGNEVQPSLMDLYTYLTDKEYNSSKDTRINTECIMEIFSILKSRNLEFKTYKLDLKDHDNDLPF